MATAPPRRNLPPQAEAWGRYIENQLRQVMGEAARATGSATNAQRGVAASAQASGDKISVIENEAIPQVNARVTTMQTETLPALEDTLSTKILDTQEELRGEIQTAVQGAGGNWNYYSPVAPTVPEVGTEFKPGDIWFDTSNGNAIHRWDGEAWVPEAFGAAAIADSAIVSGKIADAAITVGKLAANSVSRSAIAPGAVGQMQIADFAIPVTKIVSNRHQIY